MHNGKEMHQHMLCALILRLPDALCNQAAMRMCRIVACVRFRVLLNHQINAHGRCMKPIARMLAGAHCFHFYRAYSHGTVAAPVAALV